MRYPTRTRNDFATGLLLLALEKERRLRLQALEKSSSKNNVIDTSTLLNWTILYRQSLAPGKPFDLEKHLYLRDIYSDTFGKVLFCKAGQIGISEYLISWSLWSADKRACNILYVLPNGGIVSDFSSARIGAAITEEVSPYLCSITGRDATNNRSAAIDRVGLKRIRNRYFYLRGAIVKPDGRAPQLRSIDVDCLVLDEYDEMPVAAPALAIERLGHSSIGDIRIASTPTYSTIGIWKMLIEQSDYRRWFVSCSHCGNKQTLELTDLIIESDELGRPVKWYEDDTGPFIACRKCKKKIDRLKAGEWVETYENREWHGYHLSRLYMPHKPLMDIIEGLKSLDEQKRKEVYNQSLGLPYRPRSSVSLTNETLDACTRDYSMGTITSDRVYMGVDVGRVLHVIIREFGKDGSSYLRFAGMVNEFSELGQLFDRFRVKICVIDALPETRLARQFQKSYPAGMVWVSYYSEMQKTEPNETYDMKEQKVLADRTRTLDVTLAAFISAAAKSPGSTLPASIRSIPDYYTHLTSLERVMHKKPDGNLSPVYVGDPDHYAHAENYCSIASRCPYASGWSRGQG